MADSGDVELAIKDAAPAHVENGVGPPDEAKATRRNEGTRYNTQGGAFESPCLPRLAYSTEIYEVAPYSPAHYAANLQQLKNEVMAGATVAFTQLGDSVAFSYIAKLPPLMGLHAAWIVGIITTIFGSRPGMINGATGVRAAVLAPYVDDPDYGLGFVFYIILMISVYQLAAGLTGLSKFVRLVPYTVMIGFCDGLAIILAAGQAFQFKWHNRIVTNSTCAAQSWCADPTANCACEIEDPERREDEWITGATFWWMVFELLFTVGVSLAVPFIPKIGRNLPNLFIGIMLCTGFEQILRAATEYSTPLIGDLSTVSGGFPTLFFLDDEYKDILPPLNGQTIKKVLAPAFIAAAAGAVECVMTMEVVNDLTDTTNPRPNQQLLALSLANFIGGMFATMGGGATIGPTVINCTNGANGRFRLSGIVAAVCMFAFVMVLAGLIELIPTASLVGMMTLVVYHTFEWASIPLVLASFAPMSVRRRFPSLHMRKVNRIDALVIVLVTVVTLIFDLFIAVVVGVCITACASAWYVGERIEVLEVEILKPDPLLVAELRRRRNAAKDSESGEGVEDEETRLRHERLASPTKIYHINGPLFFASSARFVQLFKDASKDPDRVEVKFHCEGTAVMDFSGLNALNNVGARYVALGKSFHVRHLDYTSAKLIGKADVLRKSFIVNNRDPSDISVGVVAGTPIEVNADAAMRLNVLTSWARGDSVGSSAEAGVADVKLGARRRSWWNSNKLTLLVCKRVI